MLESMELGMLEWRYKISDRLASFFHQASVSKDITLVTFDDQQQFNLGIARFNEQHAQEVLASALSIIESGNPAIVVVDFDLRGAVCHNLTKVLRQNRNIVLALFGNLEEGGNELPSADFLTHAAAYGYDELLAEQNGLICRLPIDYRDAAGFAPLPSLTQAVIDLHRRVKGVGPSSQFFFLRADRPLYVNFRRIKYPSVSLEEVLKLGFDPDQFKNRIVLIGSVLTPRQVDTYSKRRTPLQNFKPTGESEGDSQATPVPNLLIHADSISTLLDNAVIYSFPQKIAYHLLLLLGALFGAVASILPLGVRALVYFYSGMLLVCFAQVCFQAWHLAIPVVPPIAVLTLGFILGTFIYLDTDLRQRNRELAQARESMQVRAEEERQRIAEDLHDETLPALSAVARMADKLSKELEDHPVPLQMREKLDVAVSEMRRVINDLHPSVLETMGFKPALENLLSILARETGMESHFADGDGKSDYHLPDFTKLQLYRIVQEALTNIEKHSHATFVELNIRAQHGTLIISVTDNGKGIDPKLIRPDSHGLLNIRQRAQLIGAHVEWREPEKFSSGTELRLKMPMDEFEGKERRSGEARSGE